MSESVCRSSPVVVTPESYAGGPGDLLVAVDDPAAVEVVRRKLDLHPVAGEDAHAMDAHAPREMAEEHVVLCLITGHPHPEGGIGETFLHNPHQFDDILGHRASVGQEPNDPTDDFMHQQASGEPFSGGGIKLY